MNHATGGVAENCNVANFSLTRYVDSEIYSAASFAAIPWNKELAVLALAWGYLPQNLKDTMLTIVAA